MSSDTISTGVTHGQVDWRTARVVDAVLTVKLIGAPSSDWVQRVEGVIELLQRPGSGWDHIKVTNTKLKVTGVTEGCEHDLHHLVESAIQQANADFASREHNSADSAADPESTRDSQMTGVFRAFAGDGRENGTAS